MSNLPLPNTLIEAFKQKQSYGLNGPTPLRSNVRLEEAERLYQIVSGLKIDHSAEVGFAQGISALAILKGMEDSGSQGHHHVIDPFQDSYEDAGVCMVERARLNHRMTFYRQFPEEVIPTLPELDFIFIDASHLYDLSVLEFVLADKKLKVGGIMGFHDLWCPAMQKMMRYVLSNRNYKPVFTQELNGGGFKRSIGKMLSAIPKSDKIFAPELLQPFSGYGFPDLGFIQKCGHDDRPWPYYVPF